MVTSKNPSIPLTKLDLASIGRNRLAKQFTKRLVLVLVPAFLVAVMGVAFHKTSTFDLGFAMVALAMIGAAASILVVLRWYNRAVADFANTHAGNFWVVRKDQPVIKKEA